ncbi:hypothetical protein LDENG_00224290 [Lucifuga dentata]|nr:hypothetical protein LDENG_00224290 [Lucifuga dentata]
MVWVEHMFSNTLTLDTGAPQGCVLSPLLYSTPLTCADDTVVVGLISHSNETAYLDQVDSLSLWCRDNHLYLNFDKTEELVVDFRRQ